MSHYITRSLEEIWKLPFPHKHISKKIHPIFLIFYLATSQANVAWNIGMISNTFWMVVNFSFLKFVCKVKIEEFCKIWWGFISYLQNVNGNKSLKISKF